MQIVCSFIEIYMEKLSDLLAPGATRHDLKIRQRPDQSFFVVATEVPVLTLEDVFLLIRKGNAVRFTAATEGNAKSSRSHAIFQVKLTVTDKELKLTRTSDLSLVDLAGSEKVCLCAGV